MKHLEFEAVALFRQAAKTVNPRFEIIKDKFPCRCRGDLPQTGRAAPGD